MVNILIVEDEALTALDLKNLLTEFAYNVIDVISSGEEAISKILDLSPI